MSNSVDLLTNEIEHRILTLRGLQVMLDRDLAELYGVTICDTIKKLLWRLKTLS